MPQLIDRNREIFDAVVVGSGATGGWAAKQLSEAGLKVAVLEAGPEVTPAEFSEHLQPYQLKYRGASPEIARDRPVQSLKYACRESNYRWFVNDIENPYTTAEGMPFQWTRCRVVGGRTLTWGRQSYRFSDLDFKAASRDGFGEDWPISYSDLAPYYEKVERYVGISGEAEGLAQLPDSVFLPAMERTCGERHFESRVESKLGIAVTMGRTAILTKAHNGRAACHYCGPCEQGCVTFSYFSSPWTTLADATKTGRATVVANAVVQRVTVDRDTGRASGVAYVDRLTRAPRELRAKVVVLCASSLESARILMNSGEGFCNSSGVLGRYVMDHISGSTSGRLPVGEKHSWSGAPARPNGMYIPRFRNLDRAHTDGMIRGYGYQGGTSSAFQSRSRLAAVPGFGESFKRRVHDAGWTFSLSSFAECLPRYENYVELDSERTDAWGIPALRMHVSWSDNEQRLTRDAAEQAEQMLEAAGAAEIRTSASISIPGGKTHEIGGARMGDDPRRSVLNRYCQTHDVENLFVTDGAAFVSSGCQNPTLTMMALTLRACDYLVDAAKRGAFG